jgi:hypothetical protein
MGIRTSLSIQGSYESRALQALTEMILRQRVGATFVKATLEQA